MVDSKKKGSMTIYRVISLLVRLVRLDKKKILKYLDDQV